MSNIKPFRIISGGRQFVIRCGSLEVGLSTFDNPPFLVSALVLEEDTFLMLSAHSKVEEPKEHPIRTFTNQLYSKPHQPGSVVVRLGHPVKILAVIHDLSRLPTWNEDWIESAYERTLEACEQHKIHSIGMPLLGTLHGRFAKPKCAKLLAKILNAFQGRELKRVWVLLETSADVAKLIKVFETESLINATGKDA